MRGRVLVTRPHGEAQGLVLALEARGFTVHLEPLLEIVPLPGVSVPLDGVQGVVATSANGIKALAAALPDESTGRRLPVWAVGEATRDAAHRAGFAVAESAGGDTESLARLIAARVDPGRGTLLHAAGTVIAGDLAGDLARMGYQVRRVILYAAHAATGFSPPLIARLDDGSLNAAVFFSPRTARTFVSLIDAAGRRAACRAIAAYGLSQAVEQALAELPWRAIRTAARPSQESLLDAMEQDVRQPRS
jgi:uroporphyrinogen-III synthase